MIKAPYRFVPLSSFVLLPDWAKQVSHDVPFKDGVCGELMIELTTYTPLCVGGRQITSTRTSPAQVHFFRTPDGTPVIPGSSIKGMLRNVLEIASYARFDQVEDQKLGVRDITEGNFYTREVVNPPSQAGWLTFMDGQWRIRPCQLARLHQADIIQYLGLDKEEWKKNLLSVRARYTKIGLSREIDFEISGYNRMKQALAKPAAKGRLHGRIVVTGQPGKNYEDKNAKKWEFIFYDEKDVFLPVSDSVMRGFLRIHESGDEWKFWLDRFGDVEKLPLGIPVFFHSKNNMVSSFGLAMMYKLPYRYSLHDAIGNTQPAHLNKSFIDLCDMVFGCLGNDLEAGLRGRVNIGTAFPCCNVTTKLTDATVLNSPKPTFYPAYIRQDGEKFRQLMEENVELAGWKRYKVKKDLLQEPSDPRNTLVQVRLEVLDADSKFTFPIKVHNLRPVELGALLWALDFGGHDDLRHSLGAGKPYGFGQIGLSVKRCRLRHNNGREDINDMDYITACRLEFRDFMNQALSKAGINCDWEDSEPMKALLDIAQPARNAADYAYMPSPTDFMDLRRAKNIPDFISTFHSRNGIKPLDKDYKADAIVGYDSVFEQNLTNAPIIRLAAEEKAHRAKLKKEASDEYLLIYKLQDLMAQTKTNLTDSLLKNINKTLREAYDIWGALNEEQEEILCALAHDARLLGKKQIIQICNKILGGQQDGE